MAKNMTRKGLAIGAASALAVAGLVGVATPAQAAVGLLPSVGDSNRVPISEPFTLQSDYQTGDNGSNQPMSVQVLDEDRNLTSVTLEGNNGVAVGASYDSDDKIWTATLANAADLTVGEIADIVLTPKAELEETFAVEVVTFFDSTLGTASNGKLDAGETQSSPYNVFFHVADDYDWVLDFERPVIGETSFKGSISTTPNLNIEMIETKVAFAVGTVDSDGTVNGVSHDAAVSETTNRFEGGVLASDASAEYDLGSTDSFSEFAADGNTVSFEASSVTAGADQDATTTLNDVAAGTHRAGVVFNGEQVEVATVVVGAATIDELDNLALVAGPDVNGNNLREGSTVAVEADVILDSDAVDAGEVVNVAISEGTMATDSSLTAGGETLEDGDDPIEFTVTTDEDGQISFDVDASGLEDGDTFNVELSAQTATSINQTFTVAETEAAELIEHNLIGDSAAWKVEDGNYTIRFAALDNFGQPLQSEGFRVRLNNGLPADDVATGLVGGVATFSVSTEKSDETDVETFTAFLEAAAGAGWVDAVTGNSNDQATLAVSLGASNPADAITIKNEANSAFDEDNDFKRDAARGLALRELGSANERLGEIYPGASGTPTITVADTLNGTLVDESGVQTYGSVTLSGDGVMFKAAGDASKNVYSLGSITVQTNASGQWAGVEVYTNTAGDNTITLTSGSASQDIVLTVAPAAEETGTNLVIDAPSAVEPGSTLVYTATLTDKYGNPVNGGTTPASASNAKFNYDGPGFVVGDLPSKFGADGAATVTIFLGNNDDGKTGTLTVSYTPTDNDDATYAYDGDDDLVVQKTVNIGDVPLAAGEFNAWTKLIDNDTAVKFYAKNPSDQGKIQFFFNGEEIAWHRGTSPTSYEGGEPRYNVDQDAYYLVRDVELVSGMKNVFEIEQDGERIWRAVKTLD